MNQKNGTLANLNSLNDIPLYQPIAVPIVTFSAFVLVSDEKENVTNHINSASHGSQRVRCKDQDTTEKTTKEIHHSHQNTLNNPMHQVGEESLFRDLCSSMNRIHYRRVCFDNGLIHPFPCLRRLFKINLWLNLTITGRHFQLEIHQKQQKATISYLTSLGEYHDLIYCKNIRYAL